MYTFVRIRWTKHVSRALPLRSVTVDLEALFSVEFVAMFMIYLHAEFYKLIATTFR
jgi:hypothetical protein